MRICSAPIEGGPELTSAQLFDSAEVRFTRAMIRAILNGSLAQVETRREPSSSALRTAALSIDRTTAEPVQAAETAEAVAEIPGAADWQDCDDLYAGATEFAAVYGAIATRGDGTHR